MCCIDPQLHADGGGSLIIALDTKSTLFRVEAIGYVYFWLNIDIAIIGVMFAFPFKKTIRVLCIL